ncbi:hypothetical protein [Parvularcula dongshanensis]|uniref:Putative membrane protein n=1 Tax=Parvularcula dongshanensis TaxID=1173995 RepID=A0A840I6B7_9PROT|nr:hypothetical protein [Parvularcula dongshanensis]MBB4659811.1 putative membrane protein [Parvularcula dongshanensis]
MVEDLFEEEERERIEAAVAEAETRTGAEIVVMVVRHATDYRTVEMTAAGIAALTLPAVLLPFPSVPALMIWLCQLVLFAILGVVLPAVGVGRRLVGKARLARDVRAAAEAEFFAHGLRDTGERAAVLIYAAMAERSVEVLCDTRASEVIGRGEWRGLAGDLARRLKAKQPIEGLTEAAARAGDLLAPHFPPGSGTGNELPDVIVS